MINEQVLLKAIDQWGLYNQVNQACEECAEFVAAVNHYKRERISLA